MRNVFIVLRTALVMASIFFSSTLQAQVHNMGNIEYSINLVDSPSPVLREASSIEDVLIAYREHDWNQQLIEMKRRFENNDMYYLPQLGINRKEAYMIIEPGYDGTSTVSVHKISPSKPSHYIDTNLHGYKFSEKRVVEVITRFLKNDDNWLWDNLKE